MKQGDFVKNGHGMSGFLLKKISDLAHHFNGYWLIVEPYTRRKWFEKEINLTQLGVIK